MWVSPSYGRPQRLPSQRVYVSYSDGRKSGSSMSLCALMYAVRSSMTPPWARVPTAAYQYMNTSNWPAPDWTSSVAFEVSLSYGTGVTLSLAPVASSKGPARYWNDRALGWLARILRVTPSRSGLAVG